eukprot:8990288-Pyramimonas_sp.AAC.1
MTGTQQCAGEREREHRQREQHWSLEWRSGRGPRANRSCGVALWIKRRLFPLGQIRGFVQVPRRFQGRAA